MVKLGRAAPRLILVLVFAGLGPACGGDDSIDSSPSDADSGTQTTASDEDLEDGETFHGDLGPDRPAVRQIDLVAGEALKVFARPTSCEEGACGDGISLAIAIDSTTANAWASASGAFDSFFSDDVFDLEESERFFSEYESGMAGLDIGALLFRTAFYTPPDTVAVGEASFVAYGRGWGSAAANGSWVMFVAPATATYQLLVAGFGEYDIALATRVPDSDATEPQEDEFDEGPSTSTDVFPFAGAAWGQVVSSHVDWFFDDFFPVDDFFSDYYSDDEGFTPNEDEPYGPNDEVRAEVEEQLEFLQE